MQWRLRSRSPLSSKRQQPFVRIATLLAVALVVLLFDQASKAFMRSYLADGPREFIPGVLGLRLVENTGAAFSMGEGSQWLFVIIAILVCAAAIVWVALDASLSLGLISSLGLVVGGGVANLVDRIWLGAVTDFFATEFINFPIFNVADIGITCGVVLTLLLWWLQSEKSDKDSGGQRG